MPPPLGLVNLSVADLIAEAGGDPWKINDDLQAGDPGAINAQADAFHTAAGAATEIESDFKAAKERFEKGWQHSGAQHPITDSAEVTRATQTLHLQKPQLATIALNLENVATALVAAQRACDADIAALDTFLHGADDAIGAAKATNQDTRALHDAAVATMRITLGEVQGSRDTYVNAMAAAESSMAAIPGEGPQAAGGSTEASGPTVTKGDVAIAGAGAVAGGTADGVRQTTLKMIADSPGTGPGAADPGLLKWLEDPKIGGVELKGFSRVGGLVAAVSAVPSVMSDIHDGNSVTEAVTRETFATAAGLGVGAVAADMAIGATAGSVVPGVGTAIGLVAGAAVGAGTALGVSKVIDWGWDPVADAVESVFGFG
ncbi:putative alpha/beta hydrolase [Mycolicibacterium fluoranthenivorans]|uniref:Predicted hydrolase N-terminal domain-containing protein n=1 Tax=Mycolicibacterium fluoranthenivorans TaxID=258505 RepID=A0A7X5ZB57_9MYCO|nr:hypothetical protein [Mycolicibacterium fluoranthenivorans]NIH94019.1 hypothetical protein [Mycolicibacterium fluoranthenivorans]